jgi:peptidoglycan/xylan/chitin deacetylase (PgdA/CDA1 family)
VSRKYSDAAGVRDRLVLGYHAISDVSVSRRTVATDALARQVSALLGWGYTATTFSAAVLGANGRDRLAVTFDDGDVSIFENALPILADLGVPGTVFVVVQAVGAPGFLNWEQLAALAAVRWEIGSHTMNHARLPDLDDVSLDADLLESRSTIEERLGLPCRSIAYPYSAWDARVRSATVRAGYTAGCVTGRALDADVLGWPRVGVDGRDGRTIFRLKTSRAGRAIRDTRLGGPLDRTGRLARSLPRH